MSDKVFFDTNILLYTIGQHDARTPTAEALLASGGLISVQVLNELAAVARRKLRMAWPEVTGRARRYSDPVSVADPDHRRDV